MSHTSMDPWRLSGMSQKSGFVVVVVVVVVVIVVVVVLAVKRRRIFN